jgi:hypothetical protein
MFFFEEKDKNLKTIDSRFKIQDSRLGLIQENSDSKFKISDSRFGIIQNFRFKISDSRFQIQDLRFKI